MTTLLVATGLLGLVTGSFLNVVAYRVPRGESVVSPGSRCPSCATPIRPWHNVPVLGWLVLRGRCAACGSAISIRYPLVEVGTAALFLALTARLGQLGELGALPAFLYFAALGIALALIDLAVRRLPNSLVLPSYPVLALLLLAAGWWQGDWWALVRAAVGGAALYGFFLLLLLAHPAAMGFGDVKLAGLVGGVLGYLSWSTLVVGAFAAFMLGALAGVALIVLGRGGRKTAVAFGPFLVAGALLAVFASASVGRWYAGLLG